MTLPFWMLIGVLAVAAFSVRVLGLIAGDRIRASRFSRALDDVPGLIIVSLVAASLADQPFGTWVAAAVALIVAWASNHVILTMCAGVAAFGALSSVGF